MRFVLPLLLSVGCSSGGPGALPASPLFFDAAPAAGISFITTPPVPANDDDVLIGNQGHGAAVGDYDGDGDLDIYLLARAGEPNRLYRNDLDQGSKTFTDVTPAVLADLGMSRVAHFADLDNDGDKDLVLINDDDGTAGAATSKLFRNNNGTWEDATPGSGFRPVGYIKGGAALADYDRDGLLDIFVSNWGREGASGTAGYPGSNRLYRNLGGFVFSDVTGILGIARDSFSAVFADFTGNGFPDLYVAVDHTSDEFYLNSNGTFSNATAQVGTTHLGNDMGVAIADFDDDGDLDMYTTNITDPQGVFGERPQNVLYFNLDNGTNAPVFVDEAVARGVGDTYFGWGTQFVDVENDGDLDLVAVSGYEAWITIKNPTSPIVRTPSVLFLNDGTGHFARRANAGLEMLDDSRALIAFDYDRDGDQDLLISNIGYPARLMENTAAAGHWLGVALGPDNEAIGAAVYATIGAVTKRRDIVAGRSYLSGTPSEVHFGLGSTTTVDQLRIVWASGAETVLNNVAADQLLRVQR